jgi:hypothetical protein
VPRPRRKPKEFTGRNQPSRELVLTSKWQNLIELEDFRGKTWRRFYKLESLASALDKLIRERDRLMQPAVEQLLGTGRISEYTFTLADEDALRFLFHVRVTDTTRKRANLVLVVAKNAEEASRRVQLEHKHLKILAERIPDVMAVPLRAGSIFMPDRYRRSEHNRDIAAYITTHHGGYVPLSIHRNGQYMACGAEPYTFTKRDTELLREKMVSIIVSAFHPIKRDGMDTHQLDPSSFLVHRGGKGAPGLKLANCVHMQTRLTPAKVLGFLLTDTWKSRGLESPYVPEDPDRFFHAVCEGAGREAGVQWIAQYVRLARGGKVKSPAPDYLNALAALCPSAE